MSNSRKKRLSMLDSMAQTGAPAPDAAAPQNRALRSARDAVDAHNVWDLDPALVEDDRPNDRLDPFDVQDLQAAIEANGQTVPILVRRHPSKPDRYHLVYGRRRLEAIRASGKVDKVRALIANLDDTAAITAQVSENMARRDLTFIEKALFAHSLISGQFGTQQQVADVLTVSKSSISMALAIVDGVGPALAKAIGAADGIGRPRWDSLARAIGASKSKEKTLIEIAEKARRAADGGAVDPSITAFEAVFEAVQQKRVGSNQAETQRAPKAQKIEIGPDAGEAQLRRTARGLQMHIADTEFADWLEAEAADILSELHARWKKRAEG